MINVTRLLCGGASWADTLRYPENTATRACAPVVVWNATRRCTLSCRHCYSDSSDRDYPGELSTAEAEKLIADLGAFGVPVLIFSGGEPLLRSDFFRLHSRARGAGMRTVVSTNGALITRELAARMRDEGVGYVGVSVDGAGAAHDRFRGRKGAFQLALGGIRNCREAGQKTGLRFTITRHNVGDLGRIFDLVEREGIRRACFYHLVYAGRGSDMKGDDLTHDETRRCIDMISDWAVSMSTRGLATEVLTVDNHADGAYIYLKLAEGNNPRAAEVRRLLAANGGNRSGIGIASVDSEGHVHPDQFWRSVSFGSVRERRFGEIWGDTSHEVMRKLKDRGAFLAGRCARCRFLDICNGNMRVRAEVAYGDMWREDPACYLTEEEIHTED